MEKLRFKKELYSKEALLKAAYNYTDRAYVHLDADHDYYYVELVLKDSSGVINKDEFENEMLTQSVRHVVYNQTKEIRKLLMARAMATSVITKESDCAYVDDNEVDYSEDEILKDWFEANE